MAPNELHQFSHALALMAGVATHGIPLSTILAKGTHGLGTFKMLTGELIHLDGHTYQMKADGGIRDISLSLSPPSSATGPETLTPFAQVTDFRPTHTFHTTIPSKQSLTDIVLDVLPHTRNHFLAIRIDGAFASITTRTAEGQLHCGEPLTAVAARQVNNTFERVRGSLVGFRSPGYMHGLSVAGDHLHFITDDRTRGGHVLAMESDGEVQVQVAVLGTMHMQLPQGNDEFDSATMELDAEGHAGLTRVEG